MNIIKKLREMLNGKKGEFKVDFVVGVIIGALILVVVLGALRGVILKQACTAGEAFTITSDSGAVYNFTESGLACTTNGTLYSLVQGLAVLVAIVAVLYKIFKSTK